MLFPGLTVPVIQGEFTVRQRRLTQQEQESIGSKIQPIITKPRRFKIHPLKRGWSGGQPGGRALGPPDPVDGGL